MIKNFMKVGIANGDENSPRKPDSPKNQANFKDMKELRVGEYLIKA